MTTFTFITGNPHKARYVAEWLGTDVPHQAIELDEIQTLDLRALVTHKAKQAYALLQSPVLVEDAQLVFTAMGRLPGPYIKWFVEELGAAGIAKMLDSFDDRSAYGRICFGLYDGKNMQFFEGDMRGTISRTARGEGGFGFDPVFINDGYTKTRAEMTEEEYASTSYRKKALDALKETLQ